MPAASGLTISPNTSGTILSMRYAPKSISQIEDRFMNFSSSTSFSGVRLSALLGEIDRGISGFSTTPLPLQPTKPNNLAKHLIPLRQMHHRPLLAPKIRKLKANLLTTITILNRNLMDLANVVEQQVPASCFLLLILRSGGQVWVF
jgi:hypothetical protein